MAMIYHSLLGYEQGAKHLHVHETRLDIRSEEDRQSHYQHIHAAEEAIYILEGEAEYEFDGATHRVGPGELLFFPSGIRHAKSRIFSEGMRYLVIRSVEEEDEPCCCGKDKIQ